MEAFCKTFWRESIKEMLWQKVCGCCGPVLSSSNHFIWLQWKRLDGLPACAHSARALIALTAHHYSLPQGWSDTLLKLQWASCTGTAEKEQPIFPNADSWESQQQPCSLFTYIMVMLGVCLHVTDTRGSWIWLVMLCALQRSLVDSSSSSREMGFYWLDAL